MVRSRLARTNLLAALCAFTCLTAFSASPDIVLRGTVKGNQNNSYIDAAFQVPPGIQRLTVSFHYTGKEERTTLDIGIEDPRRFRGWSGGNKSSFTISASEATPSYLAGEVLPGTWKLWIGVPNIRPQAVASYEAQIYFERAGVNSPVQEFSDVLLRSSAGWYRGDLHMHTAHSDGQCNSQSGKKVPCPVFLTVEAAVRRHLDFIAVTDHNTISHDQSLRELQPYFDRLLLIPGREITTFEGHANVYGTTEFLDFRVGSSSVPDMNSLLERVRQKNALISINHPGAPTGEICMGCGWNPKSADMRLVGAVEAVNGGSEEGPYSGVPFWEKQLALGYRVTGVGGSDNHNAQIAFDKPGSIGSPTTVVYANDLSVNGILTGIRSGRVFVDLTASRDRLLEFSAQAADRKAVMGEKLEAGTGDSIELSAHVVSCQGSMLRISLDGQQMAEIPSAPIASPDQTLAANWRSDGQRHWLRADVVSQEGKLELLGNPVYVNFAQGKQ